MFGSSRAPNSRRVYSVRLQFRVSYTHHFDFEVRSFDRRQGWAGETCDTVEVMRVVGGIHARVNN